MSFAERGFVGSSVRDIAEVAGVQSGNLYKHFASKDAMLATLALIGYQEVLRRHSSALLAVGSDPVEQFTAVVEASVLCNTTYPQLGHVLNYELQHLSREAMVPVMVLWHQLMATMTEILDKGVDTGVFEIANVDLCLAVLGAMFRDLVRWFPTSKHSAEEITAEYKKLALRLVGYGDSL